MSIADLIRVLDNDLKEINERAQRQGYEPIGSRALDPENRTHLFLESNETMPHDKKYFYEALIREARKLLQPWTSEFENFFQGRKFWLDKIHELEANLSDYDEDVREAFNWEFIKSGEWMYDWWNKYPYAEYTQQLTTYLLRIRFERIEKKMARHREAKIKAKENPALTNLDATKALAATLQFANFFDVTKWKFTK